MHHGRGAHEGHEACGVIGCASGHFIAFGIPGFDDVGVSGVQHPFPGGSDRIGDHFVNETRGLGLFRVRQLALQQERRRRHGAHLAHQARGAACAGEDADHDFRQADLGLGVVGGKDPVAGQRDFETDPQRGTRQRSGNRLAALVGLGVHPGAFDLAQDAVAFHGEVEQAFGRVVTGFLADRAKHVQIHPGGEIGLARGDHGTLDGVVAEDLVKEALDRGKCVARQHVH